MKDLEWGISTWQLIHFIGENIDENFYKNNKKEIVNMTKTICFNLPCPHCADHAKFYLRSINYNVLDTKEKFKRLFYNFHNVVNKHLNKEEFKYEDLKKYKTYNLAIILNNFSIFYSKRYGNSLQLSLQSNQMTRRNISKKVLQWFKINKKNVSNS